MKRVKTWQPRKTKRKTYETVLLRQRMHIGMTLRVECFYTYLKTYALRWNFVLAVSNT